MSLNFCDLLVLGGDLSGVMAATLLAKRGLNVLILDDEEESGPHPNVATGLDSRSFKSLLGKLMIPDSKLQMLQENKVSGQIILSRHRVDLFPSRPLFLKEMEREFPSEKTVLEELLTEVDRLREGYLDELLSFLPIVERKEKKRFLKFLKNLPGTSLAACWGKLSPTLQTVLRCQLRLFSRGPLMDPILLQLLLFLPPEVDRTFSIRGGVRELKKLFFDKLDYFGGMVHPLGHEGVRFMLRRGEVQGIQMARYDFPTRCRYLLANMDLPRLYGQIPQTLRTFRRKREISRLRPVEERFQVVYSVEREFLPGPMKENVVAVTDPTAPLEGTNYLEINIQPASKSEEEEALLTVSFRLPPPTEGERNASHFEKIYQQIEGSLHQLIPFSNGHLKRLVPNRPEEGVLFPVTETTEKAPTASYPPSLFSPSPTSPFKNMFVLGPNLLDWLGMEGKMLGALRGIDLVWSRETKIRGN